MTYYKVYNMDVMKALSLIPDDSIDCCVTSPPYWALRDYKIEPTIWDADPRCEHEWGDEKKFNRTGGTKGIIDDGWR